MAVPWCHNNLSYAEQGSMNLTCLSASVALFHGQNTGQGTTIAKGTTNPWLYNAPSIFFRSSWIDKRKETEKQGSDHNASIGGTG